MSNIAINLSRRLVVIVACLGVLAGGALQAAITVEVVDQHGVPVPNALVFDAGSESVEPRNHQIVQQNQEFDPQFSVVTVGSSVSFPNLDKTRHHVYSFSAARQFEIQLYNGIPADPVVFDKPGLVTLGCNVHDWMIAYLYVTASSVHALSDAEGVASLGAGPALLDIAHPYLKTPITPTLTADGEVVQLRIELRENVVLPARPNRIERRQRRR